MGGRESIVERWGQRLGRLLVAPALLLLFVAGAMAIGDAVLAPAPTPDHPGFVDTVLGSRAVVAAIRLAIIFAGVFVVVSVIALIARRQWLTRVGPVHVSEQVITAEADSEWLERSLAITMETVENLERDLARAINEINRMRRDAEGTA